MANVGIPGAIGLRTSINTDSVNQDIWEYGSDAPALRNTGIERQGGIENLYETEVLNPANEYAFVTEDGQTLLVQTTSDADLNSLSSDGSQVGLLSSWGIERQVSVAGFDDVMLTADGTYITCKLVGDTVTISEYDFDNLLLHSRTVVFVNLVDYIPLFSSFNFVRYQPVHYVDDQEFALRLGDQLVILKESTPSQTIVTSLASTTVLGTGNAIRCCLVLSGILIVAGDNGRVGSFDGSAWRNYDGSGSGLGPFNDGTVMGTNDIFAIAAFGNGFAVGGEGGRLGSFDGTSWKNYDASGSGSGPSDNATLIGSNQINAMVVWQTFLVVGGAGGRMGSIDGSTKYLYTRSQTTVITGRDYPAPTSNATLIGSGDIRAMSIYVSGSEQVILVAGAAGLLGSWDWGWTSSAGINSPTTDASTWVSNSTAPSNTQVRMAYGNGLWAVTINGSSQTSGIETSPDGITWTVRTTPASSASASWAGIFYGGGQFVAAQSGTSISTVMTSPDGITWTARSIGASSATFREGVYADTLGLYVLVNGNAGTNVIWTSPDGITWTQRTTASITATGIAWGNGTLVVIGGGTWLTSIDGITWTTHTGTGPNGRGLAFSNGTFAAANGTATGAAGTAYTSTNNGATWVSRTVPASSPSGSTWTDIAAYNGLFVLVTNTNSTTTAITTSPDGITWTQRTTPSVPAGGWACVRGGGSGRGRFITMSNGTAPYSAMQSLPANPVPISNNATAVSTDSITAILTDTSLIVIASALGKIASYNGTAWNNYNSGSGFSNNAAAVGANQINAIAKFGTTYVFGAATGLLASWDGTNWKNYDGTGTGTGVYNNQTVVGAVDITALGVLNSLLWIGSAGGAENSMTSAGVFTPFYTSGGSVVSNLLTGQSTLGYVYVYRYENGLYLVVSINNNLNQGWILNNATLAVVSLHARFPVPQVSGGVTRHIITETPRFDASGVYGVSLVGYTDFVTFTSTQQYPTTLTGVDDVLDPYNLGYNYVDALFTKASSATDVFGFYAPQVDHANPTAQITIGQPNTETNIFAYGKLTNAYGLAPTVPFEIRTLWTGTNQTSGIQGTLSVAALDGVASDAVGTLLTNVGEFDDTYAPLIQGDSTVLYQFGGKWFIVVISQTPATLIQKLSNNLYKLNTISPLNLYDTRTRTMELGSADYNSRMLFNSTAAPSLTATRVVSILQGKYSNGIDTGEKLISIPTPTSVNIQIIGNRLPSQLSINPTYLIDTYLDGIYSFSTTGTGQEVTVPDKANTVYVSSIVIPSAIGGEYNLAVLNITGTTIILEPDYDGYQIGNQITGSYKGFLLFGNQYLFDGKFVYLLTLDQATLAIQTLDKVAAADGMELVAGAPTAVYFLSRFDNSIYTFDGGRAMAKYKRFTETPDIIQGLFSVRDNALVLETETTVIWIRDGVISQNDKAADQATLRLYDTVDGIVIGNNAGQWQYTYAALDGTSTVVPLVYQTSYYGVSDTKRSIIRSMVLAIHSVVKEPLMIEWTHDSFDQDQEYTQTEFQQVNADDYNENGYARVRFQPKYQRGLANAISISCQNKVLLLSLTILFDEETEAVIRKGMSK
jgi:hypothetical protein